MAAHPIPLGVTLVRRPSHDGETPLLAPVITCEGRCRGWVPHVRAAMDPVVLAIGAANGQYAGSVYACTVCGTQRRYG